LSLWYILDAFDVGDTSVECRGRVADLSVAHAAFEAAVARYPEKRTCIRDRGARDSQQRASAGLIMAGDEVPLGSSHCRLP
jgi:hypothetical protein